MGILLLLVGLLAAASGTFKLLGRVRSYVGNSPFAPVEIGVGTLTVLGAGLGLSTIRPAAWSLVVVVCGLVAVSSMAHARQASRVWRKRQESEAARLQGYLQSRAELMAFAQPNGKSKQTPSVDH